METSSGMSQVKKWGQFGDVYLDNFHLGDRRKVVIGKVLIIHVGRECLIVYVCVYSVLILVIDMITEWLCLCILSKLQSDLVRALFIF